MNPSLWLYQDTTFSHCITDYFLKVQSIQSSWKKISSLHNCSRNTLSYRLKFFPHVFMQYSSTEQYWRHNPFTVLKNHLFCLQIKALNGYFKCMASLINKLGTSISQISIWYKALHITGFPSGLAVKILPAMQEMQEMRVQSLGREDPLEEEMATHSSILARRISRTEEPGKLQSMGSQRVGHNWSD